ncbi:redoxin domain-containing protein [Aliikangiella marina]|uniref:Redoxin domain-containing protein n=1 Tax=Aliikangiella marina TaxID=1712262 RepID=A0A545T9I8_9GAMM|nr:peroxiredoxin family protein [Aliikangiella marina]TQV73869.1 redoxin domain-containing protein [Aliikangiella marina]
MNKIYQNLIVLMLGIFLTNPIMADEDEPGEGQIAPDFTITRFDGSQFKLSEYRGKKAVYLVFWNTWCTYCMKKIPKLKEAQANLNHDIEILAVNTSLKDSVKKSLAFQKRYDINYPLAFDHGEVVTDLYGVWGTPTEFIIDINGVIQHRDGVPEELRQHLASWNLTVEADQIADGNNQDCSKEQQTC